MKRLSFIDLLQLHGKMSPPSMPFRGGMEFPTWRRRFFAQVRKLMGPVPQRVSPKVSVLETTPKRDHTRYQLEIHVSAISRLRASLLVPRGIAPGEKRPGLIASHGHTLRGAKDLYTSRPLHRDHYPRRRYALFAVRAGYVVLVPHWWGWHGRSDHASRAGRRDKCNVIQMAASMYGLNVIALHVQDGQAAIDVLAARPEVDPKRIGCIGNSYGGRTTMWLSIFDKRIKACVPTGCMNTFRERSLKLSSCAVQYPFGILGYGDVPELFALIAPRAMQLQAGKKDGLIFPADRNRIVKIVREAYCQTGKPKNLDFVLHEEGHLLLWDLAQPFLDRHLKG